MTQTATQPAPKPSDARRARIASRVVLALDGLLLIAAVVLSVLHGSPDVGRIAFLVMVSAMIAGLSVIGSLIVLRQPRNLVGWLFLGSSVGFAVASVSFEYIDLSEAQFALGLPGTITAAWLTSWLMIPNLIVLVVLVPLFFPTGRLPSPRWRPVAALAIAGIVATSIGAALVPGPLERVNARIDNPVGVIVPHPLIDIFGFIDGVSGVAVFTLAAASVVVRYRHGTPLERLQLRWFAYPATLGIVGIGMSSIIDTGIVGDVAWLGGLASLAALPFAIGVAILRHRLLDIDLVIKRTIAYAALSVLLVGAEVAGVLVLQVLLESVTQDRTYAVAAATLGVAALFQPARRRIQAWVDRRFDRIRYDAARTVDGFGSRLRDRLDLDDVCAELVVTAGSALRPASVAVWVRAPR